MTDQSMPALVLRPLRPDDEASFVAAHHAMAREGFSFGIAYDEGMLWADYLVLVRNMQAGRELPGRFVASTFLLAELDGDIVGRTSVRHTLNDFLLHEGGHIGYCVLPPYRRRGYATTILQRSLVLTRQLGVERALVTCNDGNVGSVAVIVACGGQLESTVDGADGNRKRRYWIG